jgi:hypothetical protein
LRDDVRARAAELALLSGKKLELLQKLLLSESDKLHYEKSGNLERVMDLTREDALTIEKINLVDFDIAHAEDELCRITGADRAQLYESLGTGAEARELIRLRDRLRRDMEELHSLRKELTVKLESDARGIKESIQALSRIEELIIPNPDDTAR